MSVRASVAMAVCNGEKYIQEQVDSILKMMDSNDELVISYDKSSDNTLKIIQDYEKTDGRIKVVFDEGKSVESNFNKAVSQCSGKYIFLSDQDDVWINDKINKVVFLMESNPDVVVVISDGYITDEALRKKDTIFHKYHTSKSSIKNLIKGSYPGCVMAFRTSIREYVWPVKVDPPIPHDIWLGIMGSYYGRIMLAGEKLILHREHGNNYTNFSKMNFKGIVKNRIYIISEYIKRIRLNALQNK